MAARKAAGFGSPVQVLAAVLGFYAAAIFGYRILLRSFPLREGAVEAGRTAFAYCTYMLLNVFVFFPVMQSSFPMPFPFRRLFYVLLGMRVGRNTHFPGIVMDPPLVEFGDDVVIGFEAVFSAHVAEGERFSLMRVRIGSRATVGARAIVMPGVTIGEGAVVAAGAVVLKGTNIGPGEFWGGVPARCLRGAPQGEIDEASGLPLARLTGRDFPVKVG